MISIPPNGTAPSERSVHGASYADRQAANTAAERPMAIRFDDQMEVIVLRAEVQEPEAIVRRTCERGSNIRTCA